MGGVREEGWERLGWALVLVSSVFAECLLLLVQKGVVWEVFAEGGWERL